jgi:hypothetical protein
MALGDQIEETRGQRSHLKRKLPLQWKGPSVGLHQLMLELIQLS